MTEKCNNSFFFISEKIYKNGLRRRHTTDGPVWQIPAKNLPSAVFACDIVRFPQACWSFSRGKNGYKVICFFYGLLN